MARSRSNNIPSQESLMGGSMFMKIVGVILTAIALWVGSTVRSIDNQQIEIKSQISVFAESLKELKEQIKETASTTSKDFATVNNKLSDMESRIRILERTTTSPDQKEELKDLLRQIIEMKKGG